MHPTPCGCRLGVGESSKCPCSCVVVLRLLSHLPRPTQPLSLYPGHYQESWSASRSKKRGFLGTIWKGSFERLGLSRCGERGQKMASSGADVFRELEGFFSPDGL